MQLMNLNYSWKKEFKQIKSSQEKLSQRWTFCAQFPLNFRINLLKIKIRKQHKKYFVVHLESFNPIWNGGGGQSKNASLASFLKYLQNDERYDFSLFMTFSYYLFWTFLRNFLRQIWLPHESLWFCQRGTKKFQKNFFFKNFFFFWNNFFCKIFPVYIMLK